MQNPNPSKLLSPSHDVNGLTDRPGHGEAAMAASILGRVAAHLRDRPDAIAIVDGTTRLDWRALGRQVARITARLRDAGVTPGARVALALPRSADFVASVLAVWRLRACYVPFDPAMPPVRLQYQASDSGARACITRGAQRPDWLPDNMVVVAAGIDDTGPSDRYAAGSGVADGLDGTVDRVDDSHILAPWPAYVIYTSGSTGRPKGVSISHRALHAYLDGVATRLPASSIGSAAWISTPAADLGHTVLFGALWHGWTLHVVSADLAADADEFAAYMRAARIDLIKIVPGHLNGLLQAANPADVLPRQCVVLGGEPCAWQLVARILALRPACRVINHYGPTESTVGVLTHEVDPALVTHAIDDAAGPDAGLSMESMQQTRADRSALSTKTFPGVTVPLGRPLPGVVACLIGDDGTLLDGEQTGELCIGGASVADGYLHQPSLSAARFVPGSLIQGEAANETSRARDAMQAQADGLRLYRTGDRVRRLADGAFLFLGRIDDQVKVRGYRVELEEVAAQLRGLHHVRDAVVIARADGDAPPQLHGYLAGPADLDIDAFRALLASRLPDYMVPSTLQVLPVLPVTPNGKIDRAALPDPKPLPRAMAQVHGAVARENSPAAGGPSGQTSVAAMQKVDTNQNDPASTLLAIWRQVLRRDDIDMEDNFFEIGGDSILSLQIIAKWRRVGWKLTPKQMFAHPTVAGAAQVAQRIDTPTGAAGTATSATTTTVVSGNNVNVTPHAPAPQESAPADATVTGHRVGAPQPAKHATPATSMRYPATPMQQGLLFHAMRDAAQGVYLGQLRLTLDGVAADLMREAWQCVLDRHPVLRTAFDWPSDSDAWQVVASDVAVPWTVHDYRERTDYEAHYVAARDADLARGIDTRHAPLFRVALFQRPDGAADLLWTHHHVLTDGWSTAQLIAEVLEAYQAKVAGNSLDYVPAASSYADYVAWRGAQPDGHAFWQARLAARDAPAMVADIAALPLGRSIKPADVSEASVCHDINTVRHQRIMHAASRAQVTLSTLLQAAWALVLTQYAGRTQAVFGVTLSGRPEALPESDRTIGLFINTLPVWIDVERTRPLIQWLRDLQSASVSLHEVAHTPLQHLQQWAGAPTAPLFDSTLVVENYPLDARLRGDAARVPDGPRVRAIEARDRTHLPLTIVVAPAHLIGNDGVTDRAGPGAALRVSWRWQPQTCDGTVIRRMAGAFDGMLDQLVASVIERAGQDASSHKVCVRDVLASATATQRALSPVAASGSLSDCLPSTSTPVAFQSVMSRIAAQAVARAECVAITAFSASSDGPGRGNALDVAPRGIEAMQDDHGKQAASRETTDLDYAALMHVSARIARRCLMALVQSKAGTEPRIGVALPRDIHLVPSLLGVLRAGAVYVPLDPENPDARLAYIGRDAALDALIVDPALVERFSALLPDVPRIVVDVTFKSPGDSSADVQAIDGDDAMSIDAPVHPAQLAYVIYTSGSTGEPKGVGVTHGNVSSLFEATSGGFAFDENDVWTLFHSYAFDFSVWEIFGALVHGGRLVVVPHWTAREPSALHALLRGQGVTVLNQTPSAFAQLTREDRENTLDSLRVVIFGGERLDAGSIVEWAQRASARGVRPLLVNMYGITETTVHVTWRVLDDALLRASARSGRSVIGEALPGWEARLCDAEGNVVPEGGQGEILVGGAGVTRGYIGRPSLTALRYVPNEAGAPGSRAYRSGDLGRAQRFEAGEPGGGADARSAGGEMGSSESAGLLLCYVGRNDDQVKIRGYRIELGEIQAALQAHPSVREAAIIVSEGRTSADGTPPGSAEDGAA
ncbi:AMP-binding protein, partial [Robbsia andropogonis]